MSSAALVLKTYPKPVDATIPRPVAGGARAGSTPVICERGLVLLRIANDAKSKWTAR
ncbi:MAG TPA: hypothetical protein VH373_09045 [Jatrophihabitantaceae bacterium]|jgi:hypothetical protein